MLPNSKLLRALCAVFLVCILSFSSFVNPAYADPGIATAKITNQESVKITDFSKDIGAVAAITGMATAIGAATSGASVTVATITTSAPGILGMLGIGVTSTVALPVAGVVGATGLVGYGIYRGIDYARRVSGQETTPQELSE
ncbi:MAG: hypothetical protein SAJ37_11325 [Oscillatoria sp. PMC 1068.18]|nr:hypothetical protein [Oscillatoria sp. PMC 1076.18]MEC4989329.1 hypothetical protein [Oscillatoria sp. PMC 1068.18]